MADDWWPSAVGAEEGPGNETADGSVESAKSSLRAFFWALAGISTVTCIVVSSMLIRRHLTHYTRPREQRKIVGILWLAPIFAVDSFLSLSFQDLTPAMDLLKEIYEGYTVYLFFALMVEYLGGEARAVELIKQRTEPLHRPFPWNYVWRGSMTEDAQAFFIGCKRGVAQFVIVRPTMAVVSAILFLNGKYTKGDIRLDQGYIYSEVINNVSVTYAMYCLVVFYFALKQPLAPHNPVPKFAAIKGVVFLIFWQELVLAILVRNHVIRDVGSWTTDKVTTGIQDLLVCFEMVIAAFFHRRAFPWAEYDRGRVSSITSVGFSDHFAISDARRDFADILPLPKFLRSSAQPMSLSHDVESGDNERGLVQEESASRRAAEVAAAKERQRQDGTREGEEPLLESGENQQ